MSAVIRLGECSAPQIIASDGLIARSRIYHLLKLLTERGLVVRRDLSAAESLQTRQRVVFRASDGVTSRAWRREQRELTTC